MKKTIINSGLRRIRDARVFKPASSAFLPFYSLFSALDEETFDFSLLRKAASEALVKLNYVRNLRGDPMVYLASANSNRASGVPFDSSFVKLQMAFIIECFCNMAYHGMSMLDALDNAYETSKQRSQIFFTKYDQDTFHEALQNFEKAISKAVVKVDQTVLDCASALYDCTVQFSEINASVTKVSEAEVNFEMLAESIRTAVEQLFPMEGSSDPILGKCSEYELPEYLDSSNYISILTEIASHHYAQKALSLEESFNDVDVQQLVWFDASGRLSLTPDFAQKYVDLRIDGILNTMTTIASDFKHLVSALSSLESYCVTSLALFSAGKNDLSLEQKKLISFALPLTNEKLVSSQLTIETVAEQNAALASRFSANYSEILSLVDENFQEVNESFLTRYKALCGLYNSQPVVSSVIDTQLTRSEVRMVAVTQSKRRKKLITLNYYGDPIPCAELPLICEKDFRLHDSKAQELYNVSSFGLLNENDIKKGSDYTTDDKYGLNFKGDSNTLIDFVRHYSIVVEAEFDELKQEFIYKTFNLVYRIAPPAEAVGVLYFGFNTRYANAGVRYYPSRLDTDSCSIIDCLLAFRGDQVVGADQATLAKLYRDRIGLLGANLLSMQFVPRRFEVDTLSVTSDEDVRRKADAALMIQTYYGKSAFKDRFLNPIKKILLPTGVKRDDLNSKTITWRSDKIDRVQTFTFAIPRLFVPSLDKLFKAGHTEIKGVVNRARVPNFVATADGDTCNVEFNIDLYSSVKGAAKIYKDAADSTKVTIYRNFDDPFLLSQFPYIDFAFVGEEGVILEEHILRNAAFFDGSKRAIDNMAAWVHGALVSYTIIKNQKFDGFFTSHINEEILIKNLKSFIEYLQKEYDPDTYADVDYMQSRKVGEFVTKIQAFCDSPSYNSAREALDLMDLGSYGSLGDVNLIVPMTIDRFDDGWIESLASRHPIFKKRCQNFSGLSLNGDESKFGDKVWKLIEGQIVSSINEL